MRHRLFLRLHILYVKLSKYFQRKNVFQHEKERTSLNNTYDLWSAGAPKNIPGFLNGNSFIEQNSIALNTHGFTIYIPRNTIQGLIRISEMIQVYE